MFLEILNRYILPSLALCLIILVLVWLMLAPAEARLGNLVKLVYLHGALVWTGLASFTLAGGLGLVALLSCRPVWYRGTQAAGQAALCIWLLYVLSALVVTGLTWGQWIAWGEPRVRATALILAAAVLLATVRRAVDDPKFTAVVNLVMAVVPWVVVRRAGVIRHPVNPIGGSESSNIQLFYLLIVATVASLALTLTLWLWTRLELKARTLPPMAGQFGVGDG